MAAEQLAYREAISAAIADEMREDPRVLIMGEDIAESEGPLKTTNPQIYFSTTDSHTC